MKPNPYPGNSFTQSPRLTSYEEKLIHALETAATSSQEKSYVPHESDWMLLAEKMSHLSDCEHQPELSQYASEIVHHVTYVDPARRFM
jgi:hypothetical protein